MPRAPDIWSHIEFADRRISDGLDRISLKSKLRKSPGPFVPVCRMQRVHGGHVDRFWVYQFTRAMLHVHEIRALELEQHFASHRISQHCNRPVHISISKRQTQITIIAAISAFGGVMIPFFVSGFDLSRDTAATWIAP
jgi:hypothetical protein